MDLLRVEIRDRHKRNVYKQAFLEFWACWMARDQPVEDSSMLVCLCQGADFLCIWGNIVSKTPEFQDLSGGEICYQEANIVFQACISSLRCFRTPGIPTRKILVKTGMLPCLVP